MKKAKMIGKKALSVFLAVLMVLTAWVWVAPTEASAVNGGTYYVRFTYDVKNDENDTLKEYDGNTGESKSGMKITYTKQNGSTGTYIVSWSGGDSVAGSKTCNEHAGSKQDNYTCVAAMDGIPKTVLVSVYGSSLDTVEIYVKKIEISSSSDFLSDLKTLWTGKAGTSIATFNGGNSLVTIDLANNTVTASGNGTNVTTNSTNGYLGVSAAKKVVWASSETTDRVLTQDWTNTFTYKVFDHRTPFPCLVFQ